MTHNHSTDELTSWLDGEAIALWQDKLNRNSTKPIRYAWRQGFLANTPSSQEGENPNYPSDQYYNPPETKPLSIKILNQTIPRVKRNMYTATPKLKFC